MIANPGPLDSSPPSKRLKSWRVIEHHLPNLSIFLMVAVFAAVVLYPNMVMTVPSGQVGLLWKRFNDGTVLDPRELRDEGIHIIFPWDELFFYDLRLQSATETYNAISNDGVSLTAALNIRFRLAHDHVPQLHQAIGPDYMKLLVLPEIGSRTREIIAKYTAEDIYSKKRQDIEQEIRSMTENKLGVQVAKAEDAGRREQDSMNLLNLYDTLLLSIELPSSVVAAINRKIDQYYLVREYEFRVEREQKESERKIIEANGIAEFQKIVSQGISESYLRWRGIEATLELSQSRNSKVVVIGGGKDGLPIILGNVDSAPSRRAETADDAGSKDGSNEAKSSTRSAKLATDPAISSETTLPPVLGSPSSKASSAKASDPGSGTATPRTGASASRSAKQSGGESGNPVVTTQPALDSSSPVTLSDLEALLSRIIRAAASKSGPSTGQSPPSANADQSR
jgi:regulator of protease activity HflC (stomatin/prohibitin superfamily)